MLSLKILFNIYLFSHYSIPIFIHILEQFLNNALLENIKRIKKLFFTLFVLSFLLYLCHLSHELFKAKPSIKVSVHRSKELLHLLPEVCCN